VGPVAFLLGIVIGYQGSIPPRDYGATLFLADLVGLAMVRELAKITEEVDALRTIGIAPMESIGRAKGAAPDGGVAVADRIRG
jgi:phospholipid/cholesterol/gamma-HCH transport system permease protein